MTTENRRHLLPHFTKGAMWTSPSLATIERGEGCYVFDDAGTEYLDGLAGLFCTNIGHGRSDLAEAGAAQMRTLGFYPNWGFASPPAVEAAAMIAARAPGDLDNVFFVNSGSEAVESAIKFARQFHLSNGENRRTIIAREWSYHGTTLGALSLTGVPKFRAGFEPLLSADVRHVRSTHGDDAQLASAKAVEEAIIAAGPQNVSLVIAEPVQNGRGALVPPDGYWQELRRICDKYGVLLCADEVITGFGRLGHWFASSRFGIQPDVITFAKGVTSAYVPLGGMIVRTPLLQRIWDSDKGLYNHGSTFGGHPVATAVAVANITALDNEGVLQNVLDNESYFKAGLEDLAKAHGSVREVRGCGYFYAVELMADRASSRDLNDRQVASLQGGLLNEWLRQERLLIRPDDRGATLLIISPPLVADRDILDILMSRLDAVLILLEKWLLENP